MIANIIKVAFRNLFRKFGYTFINIAGLSIGLACSILILLYVNNELTYDRFHEKADRIYRIGVRGQMPGNELNMAQTSAPMMEALLNDYPEVEYATRFSQMGGWLVRTGDRRFNETDENFIFADSSFFDVFDFKVIRGDPSTALTEPRSLVMTERYAEKYFGNEDPIGQNLRIERDTVLYTVKAVMENVPVNSHFHFEMLGSLSTFQGSRSTMWLNHNYYTYVVLAPGTDIDKFTSGLREMVLKYVGPQVQEFLGITIEQFEESGNTFGYFTQALTDIHLHSNLQYEVEANGNPVYVYIFLIIAILILLIACINFMNLATARSSSRSREVGLRKVAGSSKSLLIGQFLTESVFLSMISLVIAILLVYMLLPAYNNLIRLDLGFDIFANSYILPSLILLAILVGLLAGSYPAFVLASFRPVAVLKGDLKTGSSRSRLRSVLVILQFTVAITILLATLIVNRQLTFMQNKDLGFNKDNALIIQRSDALREKIESFKQDLTQHSNIISVSNSTQIPGEIFSNNVHWLEGQDVSNTILLWQTYTSYDLDKALDLTMKEGRYFSREMPTDSFGVIINEAAVRNLNLTDPLDQRFMNLGMTPEETTYLPIVGVVEDFHFASMHDEIQPMIFHFMRGNYEGHVIVRFGPGNVAETVEYIRQTWDGYGVEYPFDYTWMDDEFDKLFEPERRTSEILFVFSILAIFISCLGLFGLISYSTAQRTKEIGIRKTQGASVNTVMILLSREIILLLGVSTILAIPSYFIGKQWLQNFAYNINFSIGIFILFLFLVSLVVLIFALATVSYQSYKAAIANPSESLRVE